MRYQRVLHTINANSGDPEDYSFNAMSGMYMNLGIEVSRSIVHPTLLDRTLYFTIPMTEYVFFGGWT